MSTRVFVTGGTGFIGAYILRELVQKGYSVRAIRRKSHFPFFIPQEIFDRVEWVDGDILDVVSLAEAMEGMDSVIHAAGKVSFNSRDKTDLFRINTEGTANVVNMALEKNIRRFVHISSIAAIGRTATGETVTEEKKWQPGKLNTHYAVSKYHAEMEVWRGMGEGMNVVVVNPSTVLGYGDWSVSSCRLFKNSFKEFPWYTNGMNGFVGVEDVARATVMLMESDLSGERYIVCSENWPFRQLFNTIADGFGKRHPHKKATPLLGEIAWRLEKIKSQFSGRKPLLTRQSARVAHSSTVFSNNKILQSLPGFSFTPLAQTIENACKLYLLNPQPL